MQIQNIINKELTDRQKKVKKMVQLIVVIIQIMIILSLYITLRG